MEDARGGIALLMAVVAIPVIAAVGMAADYTQASAARAAFRVSLDATALMLSNDAAVESNSALTVTSG